MKAFLGLIAVFVLLSRPLSALLPPPPPSSFDYPPKIGPLTPEKAAAITKPYEMRLSDVDFNSGSAVLDIHPYGGSEGYVGINLLTGKLFYCKPQPPAPDDLTLSSPSGRLRIRVFEEGGFAIETSAGKRIKTLKGRGSERVYALDWTPDESGVIYDLSDGKDGLYLYEIKARRSKLLVRGHADSPEFSPDNRLMAFNLKKSVLDKFGVLTVLDGKSYKRIWSVGTHVNGFTFSPDGRHVAFTELVKDEFGDLASTALKVLDIETGRTTTLLTNRRKLIYVWAGDDALLATVKDKYAVPSLVLATLTGKTTVLTTDRNAGFLRPFAYLPSRKRAIYKTAKSIYENEVPEELWAVEPGHAPVRLFPVKGAGRE